MVMEMDAMALINATSTRQRGTSAVRIFAINERMNQALIEHLDPAPGMQAARQNPHPSGYLHAHAQRALQVGRLTAPHLKTPAKLNRAHCTPRQAAAGLAASAASCEQMLSEAFTPGGDGRDHLFVRDGWSQPWPLAPKCSATCWRTKLIIGTGMHARPSARLPPAASSVGRIWNWEKLWRECGFPGPRDFTDKNSMDAFIIIRW